MKVWKIAVSLTMLAVLCIIIGIKTGILDVEKMQLTKGMTPEMFWVTITLLSIADSVNPCMISLMAIMVANLAALGMDKKGLFIRAVVFTITVFITYYTLGVAIYFGYSYLYTLSIALNGFNVLKAILVLALISSGLINIKDALTAKKSVFAVPESAKGMIEKLLTYFSIVATVLLAVFVTIVELPCTGIFYLGLMSYMHSMSFSLSKVLATLAYYNLLFVLPEMFITILVWKGKEPKAIYENIYKKHRKTMRILEGLVLIALGILVWMFVKVG